MPKIHDLPDASPLTGSETFPVDQAGVTKLATLSALASLSGAVLASVGTPGTYTKVTTNSKGQITSGSNPTTLAGYGITDGATFPNVGTPGTYTSVTTNAKGQVTAGTNPGNSTLGNVTLEEKGAIGNGTANDTQAFLDAEATGKNIHGTFGKTYRIIAPINFTHSGAVTFDGHGCTIKPEGTFNAFNMKTHGVILKNFIMNCVGLNGIGLNYPDPLQQFVAEDLLLINGKDGIFMSDLWTSWFSRIQVNGFTGNPWHITSTGVMGAPTNSLWISDISINNNSGPYGIKIDGAAGIWIRGGSFQANAAGTDDIRLVGCNQVDISGCYHEMHSLGGAAINVGGGGPTAPVFGLKIHHNYYQTNKRPILIGSDVSALATEIASNVFMFDTLGGYAIDAPAGWIGNVYSNAGSMGDIGRYWEPALSFGDVTTGITYAYRQGEYRRVGSTVTGDFRLQLTSKGAATGAAKIRGIPGIPLSIGETHITYYNNMATVAGPIFGNANWFGNLALTLQVAAATGSADITNANFTDTTSIYGAFSYALDAVPVPVTGGAPAPAPAPAPAGTTYSLTVSQLHFNGNLTDTAPTPNTWTLSPTGGTQPVSDTTNKVFGSASYYFDGSVGGSFSYPCMINANVGNRMFAATGDWSYQFRVRFMDTSVPCIVMGFRENLSGNFFPLRVYANNTPGTFKLGVLGRDDTGLVDAFNLQGGPTIVVGTWYAVYICRDGNNIRLYIDGVQAATSAYSGALCVNSLFEIGAGFNNTGGSNHYPFKGNIDEFRMVRKAIYTGGTNYTVEGSAFPDA